MGAAASFGGPQFHEGLTPRPRKPGIPLVPDLFQVLSQFCDDRQPVRGSRGRQIGPHKFAYRNGDFIIEELRSSEAKAGK